MSVFQDYIFAACTSKILRRLQDSKFSKPFVDSLNAVSPFLESIASSFDFMGANARKQGSDEPLSHRILKLAPVFPKDIPKLVQRSRATLIDTTNQLYTADTCIEFHWLLCQLLQSFQISLEELQLSQDSAVFTRKLARVAFFGNGLWSVARSGAIESHLKAIEPRLLLMGAEHCGESGDNDDEEQEFDVELQSVQPSARRDSRQVPLWQSYHDWLMLMVAHIDAVAIVHRHVTGSHFPYKGVSLTVVPPPSVSEALLPWEQLLRSPHFPQSGADLASRENSNEDIIMFLRKGLLAKNVKKDFCVLLKPKAVKAGPKLATILKKLSNGFQEDPDIAKIISEVRDLKQKTQDEMAGSGVITKLEALMPDIALLNTLDGMKSGTRFKGLEHCEALLATIITHCRNPEFGTVPANSVIFQVRCVCLPSDILYIFLRCRIRDMS